MDDVTWGALTLTLTVLGGIWTWFAFRRRGLASGLRGAALTLLPLAAYLTKTLRMFTRVVDAVADWAASLVFSPFVWAGVVLAGLSVLLFGAARVVDTRSGGRRPVRAGKGERAVGPAAKRAGQVGQVGRVGQGPTRTTQPGAPAIDDDLADIEALLRRRGIE